MFKAIREWFTKLDEEFKEREESDRKYHDSKIYGNFHALCSSLNNMELWDEGNAPKKRKNYFKRPIPYYATIFCDGTGAIFKMTKTDKMKLVKEFNSIEELQGIVKGWKFRNLKGAPGL